MNELKGLRLSDASASKCNELLRILRRFQGSSLETPKITDPFSLNSIVTSWEWPIWNLTQRHTELTAVLLLIKTILLNIAGVSSILHQRLWRFLPDALAQAARSRSGDAARQFCEAEVGQVGCLSKDLIRLACLIRFYRKLRKMPSSPPQPHSVTLYSLSVTVQISACV